MNFFAHRYRLQIQCDFFTPPMLAAESCFEQCGCNHVWSMLLWMMSPSPQGHNGHVSSLFGTLSVSPPPFGFILTSGLPALDKLRWLTTIWRIPLLCWVRVQEMKACSFAPLVYIAHPLRLWTMGEWMYNVEISLHCMLCARLRPCRRL